MSEDERSLGSLASILHGSGLYILVQALSRVLGFGSRLLLTNYLGASGFGVLIYAFRIGGLAARFAVFGSDEALLRLVPENADDEAQRDRVVAIAYGTTLVGSLLFGAGMFVFAARINGLTIDSPVFADLLRLFAIFVPIQALITTTSYVFRSLTEIELQLLTKDVGQSVTRLLAAGVGILLGVTVVGMAAIILALFGLVGVAGLFVLLRRTDLSTPTGLEARTFGRFYRISFPITLSAVGGVLTSSIDVLMVGYFLDGAAVGIYDTAFALAVVISLPLLSTNQLFSPIASELYHDDERDRLEGIYATVTKWNLVMAIPAATAFVLYRREIMALFGDAFVAGGTILAVLTLGQLVNNGVGPSGQVLLVSGRQDFLALNEWALGISNALLNVVLITRYGAVGAAIATAATLTVMNVVRVGEVWYLEGLVPYSRDFRTLVVPTVLGAGVMAAGRYLLADVWLVVVGGGLGGLAFLGAYLRFGVTEEERALFAQFRARVGSDQE